MWPLPIAYLLVVGGVCAAIATTPEPGAEEVRAIIRATAFTSAVPFLLLFVAAPWQHLRASTTSRWLMRNRRYLGLSVAASHFWHLIAILVLVREFSSGGVGIQPLTKVFGTAGFVFLAVMAATSTDAAQRGLGRVWGWIHLAGVYVLWIDFIFTYSGTATIAPFHGVMTAAFALAWTLRVVVFMSARRG